MKTPEGYREISRESGPQFEMLAGEFLQDVKSAQNLVVLKTAPCHANSVAVALDNEEWPEVVGTVAGDDTILVITPDNSTGGKLRGVCWRFWESEGLANAGRPIGCPGPQKTMAYPTGTTLHATRGRFVLSMRCFVTRSCA